tara:strand:+ start:4696 stop:4932 length:237 start_codon:yes stop_codon:yes gene_type:complete
MKFELQNRDGKQLGVVELSEDVRPVEVQQALQHTAVVLGPLVCEVLAPAQEDGPRVTPVALSVAPKARLSKKRGRVNS